MVILRGTRIGVPLFFVFLRDKFKISPSTEVVANCTIL